MAFLSFFCGTHARLQRHTHTCTHSGETIVFGVGKNNWTVSWRRRSRKAARREERLAGRQQQRGNEEDEREGRRKERERKWQACRDGRGEGEDSRLWTVRRNPYKPAVSNPQLCQHRGVCVCVSWLTEMWVCMCVSKKSCWQRWQADRMLSDVL